MVTVVKDDYNGGSNFSPLLTEIVKVNKNTHVAQITLLGTRVVVNIVLWVGVSIVTR